MAHPTQTSQAAAGDRQALGQLIGTYGKSRAFLAVGWLLGAMFAGIGLFLLWFVANPGPNSHFDGDISLVYKTGYGAIALGIAIAALFWFLVASQPTFRLHENGIRASHRGSDQDVLYRDLEDIFSFFPVGTAYRAAPGAPWQFLAGRIHKLAEISSRLRSLQIEHRGALLEQKLHAGEPVVFRYFDDSVGKSKSAVASRNMDFPTHELVLTRDRLRIGQRDIALDRIGSIERGLWTEKLVIHDVDGNVFFQCHLSSILSFELLHHLIARQQELAGLAPAGR